MTDNPNPFPPGVAEQLAEAGADVSDILPSPAVTAKATFLPGKSRSEKIDLEYPVEVDGVSYEAVCLRRMTAGDVAAHSERVRALPDDEMVRFPIFFTVDGAPLPDAVLDALDDDDAFRLDEASINFLPRRFRGSAASATAPADGGTTAP